MPPVKQKYNKREILLNTVDLAATKGHINIYREKVRAVRSESHFAFVVSSQILMI